MARYVVLLRAVNVGGHTAINMEELRRRLEKADLEDVSSYRQSGNIIFSSPVNDEEALGQVIIDRLEQLTGSKVEIYLFMMERIRSLVGLDPFEGHLSEGDRAFATFMSTEPSNVPAMPVLLRNGISMIGLAEYVAFSVVRKGVGSGPLNDLLERRFGVRATTRNWSTVKGLVAKAVHEQNV
jgi:uncharacterized protein (DUF1697 family)